MKKLALLAVILAACEYNDSRIIPATILVRVDSEVGSNGRAVQLHCATSTMTIQPCFLVQETVKTSTGFTVDFKGLERPDISIQSAIPGPATCDIDLGKLVPGKYDIEFNNGTSKNTGRLEISESSVSLILFKPAGIQVVEN